MFPRGAGDLLGVDFGSAPQKLKLLNHEWPAVAVTVGLTLEPFEDQAWDAEVLFVRDEGLPFALLGYEGFLTLWAVSFNGALGYFTVEPSDECHQRQPPVVVERLRSKWPHLIPPGW